MENQGMNEINPNPSLSRSSSSSSVSLCFTRHCSSSFRAPLVRIEYSVSSSFPFSISSGKLLVPVSLVSEQSTLWTSEAMEALHEKQRQWLLQQNLRFVAQQQQLLEQQQKFWQDQQQQLDRLHQRMLELLKGVVDEEEEVPNVDCCAEQHSLADAHQVFDESPKRNAQIKPGELVGEGQEKLLEGSEVVADEPLDVSDIRLEQANLEHLGKSTTKSSLGMVLDDVAITQLSSEVAFSRTVEQKQVAQQEAERSKYVVMKAEQVKRAAIIRAAGESEAARLYCSKWKALKLYGNHGWKWPKSFSFIVFDPGKLRSPLYDRGCVIMVEPLGVIDPEIVDIIELEEARQWKGLELIPFENFTSVSVMPAMGSVMTNKYREGYPAAVLVAVDVDEALITMDSPEDDSPSAKYIEHITIPSAFIDWSFGDTLKKVLNKGNMVDARVEYELWKTSRNEGGVKCAMLQGFVKEFTGVARFKYQPHWVPLTLLWEAMDAIDEVSGEHRGYMLIFRREQEAALLFILSGKHPSWESVAKYLIEDIPSLLKSPSMRDVEEVIDVVCMSLPSNFRDFIKWVVEVRRTEDNGESVSKDEISRLMLKEDLLKQVQEIGLYNYVTKFFSSAYTCARKAAKLGPEETLSDAAAADVHTIHKLEAVSAVFDPGKLVVLRMTIAASSWSESGTWQTSLKHTLILSLEDKALEEGALIQGFSIFTVISLFATGC